MPVKTVRAFTADYCNTRSGMAQYTAPPALPPPGYRDHAEKICSRPAARCSQAHEPTIHHHTWQQHEFFRLGCTHLISKSRCRCPRCARACRAIHCPQYVGEILDGSDKTIQNEFEFVLAHLRYRPIGISNWPLSQLLVNASRALDAVMAGCKSRSTVFLFIRAVRVRTARARDAMTTQIVRLIRVCISSVAGAWTTVRCLSG